MTGSFSRITLNSTWIYYHLACRILSLSSFSSQKVKGYSFIFSWGGTVLLGNRCVSSRAELRLTSKMFVSFNWWTIESTLNGVSIGMIHWQIHHPTRWVAGHRLCQMFLRVFHNLPPRLDHRRCTPDFPWSRVMDLSFQFRIRYCARITFWCCGT